jgi:hypothetical protein
MFAREMRYALFTLSACEIIQLTILLQQQEMQNMLQNLQQAYRIYNSDVEPEHESDYYCNCAIHQYKRRKMNRLGVQDMWSKAVMYPGKTASPG